MYSTLSIILKNLFVKAHHYGQTVPGLDHLTREHSSKGARTLCWGPNLSHGRALLDPWWMLPEVPLRLSWGSLVPFIPDNAVSI